MKNKRINRTLAAVLMSATVLASAPVAGFTAPVVAEAAYKAENATPVDIFNGFTATLSKSAEQLYRFNVTKDTVIALTVSSEDNSVSTDVTIKRKINGIYVNVKGYRYTDSNNLRQDYYNLPADNSPYLICLKGPFTEETVGITATKMKDVSNHITSAKEIKMGKLAAGQLYTEDDNDYFKFNSGKYNLIKIQATSENWASNDYSVYKDTSGKAASLVGSFRYNDLGGDTEVSNYIRVTPHKTYYVKVNRWNGDPKEYSFKVKGFMDVSDSAKTAKSVKMGKTVKGKIEVKEDVDYYVVKATKTGMAKLSCSSSGLFASEIEVYRKGSAKKLFAGYISPSGNEAKFKVQKNKSYIVKVIGKSTGSTYSFKLK